MKVIPVREPFNAYSHLIGALISIVGLFFLLLKYHDAPKAHLFAVLLFGICMIGMFGSSYIYHAIQKRPEKLKPYKLFDHIMIYLMIAGTYTPVCLIPDLDPAWKAGMTAGIWIFALLGILKKTFWLSAPRWLSTVIYLLMGWISVIIFPKLWQITEFGFILWIAVGGIFYTLGAIIYGLKRPNIIPGKIGFHELWHIFVLGGAFSHYWAIYMYL